MKLTLPYAAKYVAIFVLLSVFSYNVYGQQLKTTHDPKANKGHQLYKQTKIYDNNAKAGSETKPQPVGDKASDRNEYEFNRLKNPYTSKIPEQIKKLEAEFATTITESDELKKAVNKKGGKYSYWKNRGPHNVGGRTRALAIDRYNENIIFAGGVSGGLWRSTNAGETWRKVTKSRQSPSITSIIQHPTRRNVWYYTSGERSGNSASMGSFYAGTGVYKSTNGGRTWKLLEGSADNDITRISPFDLTNSIAINPTNNDIYVATFNGVHRSQDAGESFEEVLGGGFDSWTEVITTPSGNVYATVDFFGEPNTGFFTSKDGDEWTDITPTNIAGFFNGRTVMAYDPSDENIVYFFSENLLSAATPFLLKYDAAAELPEDQWTDLSANLPINIGGSVGSLNLQGHYNMFIRIKPDDSNFIVLGGTNLYRSTTGFTTPAGQESWIGGYSPDNSVSVYKNHHPDQHNFIFYPSDPNRALSGNDGGVQVTEDITTAFEFDEPVEWISLNNGYLTTQPYVFSFDPKAKSETLLAGFQDNGTWYTDSKNGKVGWEEDFGGDGSYNAIADTGSTRYVSSQFGNIYRFNFDDDANFISFARIRPAIMGSPSFINPFILDPNNDNIMYMPDGNRILRNNNLDEVPGGTFAFATKNWVALPQTAAPNTITALDVSRYPQASRLYYATSGGEIYRMDNANLDNQLVVDISTGKGMPPGYVSNITINPSNSDMAMVVFSNYGIPSLFITEDAGETWEDISGNLEENADGTGNGSSVRWASFFGNGQSYFVGTSTGLYVSRRLRGTSTKWKREPFRIGNAVVGQVKSRNDGFVAIATHGNGLFSAKFPIFNRYTVVDPTLSVARLLEDYIVDVNSAPTTIDVSGVFVSERDDYPVNDIEITNSNPDLVTATLDGDSLTISYASDAVGVATIGLIATAGNETVSEGFTITVKEPAIYEQVDAIVSSAPSQLFIDFNGLVQSSDDFVIPEGSIWTINRVLAFGGANGSPDLDSATVVVYADDNGKPGAEVYNSGALAPTSALDDTNLNLTLPETVQLESGSYWLTVYANLNFNPNFTQWFWSTQEHLNGQESHFKDELDLFQTGAVDWTTTSTAFSRLPADQVFQIFGMSSDSSTSDNQNESVLTTLEASVKTIAWPNPSTDQFNFNVETLSKNNEKVAIRIYNLRGQLVYHKDNLLSNKTFSWNASSASAGIYIVSIKGKNFKYNGKIIKQ